MVVARRGMASHREGSDARAGHREYRFMISCDFNDKF
jgi:hypothetical protein